LESGGGGPPLLAARGKHCGNLARQLRFLMGNQESHAHPYVSRARPERGGQRPPGSAQGVGGLGARALARWGGGGLQEYYRATVWFLESGGPGSATFGSTGESTAETLRASYVFAWGIRIRMPTLTFSGRARNEGGSGHLGLRRELGGWGRAPSREGGGGDAGI